MACPYKICFDYELVTNNVQVTDTDVIFGINPCHWDKFPQEGVALLKIRQAVPAAGDALPVSIAVRTASTVSTVTPEGTSACCPTANLPLVDPINTPFIGSDIVEDTERILYFNKVRGILRIMDCCRPAAGG